VDLVDEIMEIMKVWTAS